MKKYSIIFRAMSVIEQQPNIVLAKIINYLTEKDIKFKTLHHKPTFTSEESAIERNEDVSIGGKAILMKLDDSYKLFVLRYNIVYFFLLFLNSLNC